jgi:hypothetical protein
VTADQTLARIYLSLREAGIDALVMGGHAVRYYGIDRNTIATPELLRTELSSISALGPIREESVWRRHDFARFEIGKLPDGRPQWLEFWLRNHLLDDFANLKARAETGSYGGEQIRFLSLPDLMRSKETERESDWHDIALLEEILDDRHGAAIAATCDGLFKFLSSLRSRRGMDFAIEQKLTANRDEVVRALTSGCHPVTCAFLYPFALDQSKRGKGILPPTIAALLSTVVGGSPKHFAIVEIARRDYKRAAMDRDRADKQEQLRKQ